MSLKTEIRANTKQAEIAFKKFAEALNNVEQQGEKTNKALNNISKNINTFTDKMAHSAQALNGWYDIVKGTVGNVAQNFIKTADAINTMNARLKLTTTSGAHFELLKKQIDSIARATSSSTESISNLFINLNQNTKSLGISQEKVLEISKTLSMALKASGASAIDAERAIVQFNQGLAKGSLQMQDYKAMIQAAPALVDYLSQALKVNSDQLNEMVSKGQLNAQTLITAFSNMKERVTKDFESIPPTVEGAMTNLQTSIQGVIEKINTDLDITGSVARGIESFSKVLDNNQEAIKTATQFIKNHGAELVALLAIYKTYPAIVAATKVSFEGLIKVLGTSAEMMIFGADKAYLKAKALGAAKTAAGGLLKVFGLFGPQLLIFGALDLLYHWLNKNKAAAADLAQTLNITLEQMNKMTSAQLKNTINELGNAKLELAKEYNEVASQMLSEQKKLREVAGGKGLLKDYNNELIISLQARKDSITKQIDEINAKQKELGDTLSKSAEQATKAMTATSSAVDETAKAFKSAMDSSAGFTKNITLLSDYQKEIKAINGEIDKLNELLKDNKLNESQRASALEQIERLNEARAQTEAKIAKASDTHAQKSIKNAKDIAKSYEEAYNQMLKVFDEKAEFYTIIGDLPNAQNEMLKKAEAQANEFIKKWQVTDKKAIDNINKYFKDQSTKSFESMTKGFKSNLDKMEDYWADMVGSMAKNIENSLFDFITGKTGSLKDAFAKMGSGMLSSMLSPFAQSISSNVSGIFKGIFGGNGSVADIATNLGLKLENGVYSGVVNGNSVEILTDGTIKSGGSALSSVLGLAKDASSVLSAVNGLKSAYTFLNAGLSGLQGSILSSSFAPFGYVSGALNNFGLTGLGGMVTDFGTGFSSVLSLSSNAGFGGAFAGGFAQGLGAMAGGAAIGGGIGMLGDMLFGTKTKASLGGTIGGAIGTIILPGLGSLVGGLLGSIIGGIFGSEEMVDQGIQIFGNVNLSKGGFNHGNIKRYEDWEEESWFDSDSWTEYYNISNEALNSLNETAGVLNRALKGIKENDFIVSGRKFSGGAGIEGALASGVIGAMTYSGASWQYLGSWQKGAGKEGKELLTLLADSIDTIKKNIKALKVDTKAFLEPYKAQMEQADEYFRDLGGSLNKSLANIKATAISSAELAKMYEKGIKENFSYDNVTAWNNLIEAYNLALEAQKAYTKALREFHASIYDAMIAIRSAYGQNTDVLNIQKIKTAFKDLVSTMSGEIADIADFAKKLSAMSYDEMSAYLSKNTADRTELIGYASSYAQLGTTALQNVIKTLAEYENQLNTINANRLTSELNVLKAQKGFADSLKNIANSLRASALGGNLAYYKYTLQKAKDDYANNEFNSQALSELQSAAKAYADTLKATSSSAEQYRFDVLQMANEIEGIVPADELEAIIKSIETATAELKKLGIITELSNEEQLEVAKEQKALLSATISAFLAQNKALFAELGGDFNSDYLKLIDSFRDFAVKNNIDIPAFANGGIVTSPTQALIGEAGYPEAVIPLKDGAGLKVDMDGGFMSLEKKLDKLEKVLAKIATSNDELARTMRNVSDGEVMYIKAM